MSRETFTIEAIEIRESSRGPFRKAKLSGLGYASVFSKADMDFLEENLHQQASAEIERKPNPKNPDFPYLNASGFQKVDGNAPASASQAAGADRMSKEEWRQKDDIQHLRALAASHRADMIAFYSAYPDAWAVSGIESYNDLWMRARKNAVRDLDWLRNYATGDVPFEGGENG